MDGIGEAGGSAGKAFFDDQIIAAEFLAQQAGPAFMFIETSVGVGAVAVGVGIAEAYNMFFHRWINLLWGLNRFPGSLLFSLRLRSGIFFCSVKTVQFFLITADSIAFFRKKSNKIKEKFFFLFIIDKNNF